MNIFWNPTALLWLGLAFFLAVPPVDAQEPTRGAPPAWVTIHPVPTESTLDPTTIGGGVHYLLFDKQINIPAQQVYKHFAYRVVNSDGVQNMSDIDVEYDPSYQTLQFNLVRVHRDGEVIDNLSGHQIQTFQRESGMEYNLYDGSLTAVINQKNIHMGDLIEYAYTLTGFNPVHGGDFFDTHYLKFSIPIQAYRIRVMAAPDQPLHFRFRNGATEPTRHTSGSLIEYTWDLDNVPAHLFENNTPDWYDPLPKVGLSSYDTWAQVVDWALPNFQVDPADAASLQDVAPGLTTAPDMNGRILQIIRFVQDDLRYLGMEQGLGAYRPNQPFGVFQRRFGDCKDKSLLLAALLRTLGLDAHPMLVNTELGGHVDQEIPSPLAFNHCVVQFTHDGRNIFVDPTRSNQGGDLDHMAGLPYGRGLVIAAGIRELTELPPPPVETTDISYRFTVGKQEEPTLLTIHSRSSGPSADLWRDQFLNHSIEEISRSNLDYISEAYPGITQVQPTRYTDDSRDGENILVAEESYSIADFWVPSAEDSSEVYSELAPLELMELVDIPASAARSAPYATGPLMDMSLTFELTMPADWPVENIRVDVGGDAFTYFSEMTGTGNKVEINYRYQRRRESIAGAEAPRYIADHNRIWDDLFFYVSDNPELELFRLSWLAIGLSILVFCGGCLVVRRIHRRLDPAPAVDSTAARPVGGWLILPAISILLAPFILVGNLFLAPVYFDHNMWLAVLGNGQLTATSGLGLMLAFELLSNSLLPAFSLLILVQFLQKRSSLPKLMAAFLVGEVLITALDVIGVTFALAPELGHRAASGQLESLTLLIVQAGIWVPYFLTSRRVKQTFINRRSTRTGAETGFPGIVGQADRG